MTGLTETIIAIVVAPATYFVIEAVKKYAPRVPKRLLPYLTLVIGPALDLIARLATDSEGNLALGALYGLAAVGLHEGKKQLDGKEDGSEDVEQEK